MLCRSCRRQVGRGDPFCHACGVAVDGRTAALDLVLPGGARVPLADATTIGRSPASTVRLEDRSVSRTHARVTVSAAGAVLEDAGSSHGTLLDGHPVGGPAPLRDGSAISVGDVELRVERHRDDAEAGRTVVVPVNGSVVVAATGGAHVTQAGTQAGFRPRMRPGWKLKRMAEGEGRLRYVLSSEHMPDLLRMGDADAALVQMLDGETSLPELMAEAERVHGDNGVGRLARLLADLGERGLLEGVDAPERRAREGLLGRLTRPRERAFPGAGAWFERLYRRGGWVLFTRTGLIALALVAVSGLIAFTALIVGRGGTPFVVADRIGIGGLVFIAGRALVVAVHEIAHGLAMASFGRTVPRAGVKAILGLPFAFVDTTEAWFEPRRRRMAISAAGPVADLVVGGAAGLVAWSLPAGNTRDVVYQVALAAYIGAFYNLNPFLDRDGYHILVDRLGEPGLRKRARDRLDRRLSGAAPVAGEEGRGLRIYSLLSLAWMIAAAGFVILLSLLYYDRLTAIAPPEVVWTVLGALYCLLFVPVIAVVARPLLQRRRGGGGAAGAVG
ncbi:FHA domain-containing protein [Miltoncostaea oceani]|uniref:FHA domain-containing protein n=1 Tax=Miltoncostaea oceani TaxID=2843216 RepID=UPI001C3D0990|nr:FHA domain-containing protein [Miltoncostaea oceani]